MALCLAVSVHHRHHPHPHRNPHLHHDHYHVIVRQIEMSIHPAVGVHHIFVSCVFRPVDIVDALQIQIIASYDIISLSINASLHHHDMISLSIGASLHHHDIITLSINTSLHHHDIIQMHQWRIIASSWWWNWQSRSGLASQSTDCSQPESLQRLEMTPTCEQINIHF